MTIGKLAQSLMVDKFFLLFYVVLRNICVCPINSKWVIIFMNKDFNGFIILRVFKLLWPLKRQLNSDINEYVS